MNIWYGIKTLINPKTSKNMSQKQTLDHKTISDDCIIANNHINNWVNYSKRF